MPYPNEHACRLADPKGFEPGSFSRSEREHNGKKYDVIQARPKGKTKVKDQAYRYKKDIWSASSAKSHCKAHDGTFEAAAKKDNEYEFHAKIRKQLDTDDRLFIEGWASTAHLDRGNEVVTPEAFREGISGFKQNPILLYMHDVFTPIGKVVDMTIDKVEGFWVKAFLSKAEDVASIVTKVKEGILSAFSIGFRVAEGGSEIIDNIRHITELELYEVSIVSIPANREALFDISKGLKYGTDIVVPEYVLEDKIKEVMEEYNLQPINKDGEIAEPEPVREDVSIIEYENFEKAYKKVSDSLRAAKLISKLSGKNFNRKLTKNVSGGE